MSFAAVRARYGVKSWRSIKGFENYRVTSCGRVWSISREKFIRQDLNLDSYYRVELFKNGVRTWQFVHRLVCNAYKKNKRPKYRTQVNHMDHDRHNNNAWNLEHVTPSANMKHARRKSWTGYIYKGRGRWKKLSYEEARLRAGTPF